MHDTQDRITLPEAARQLGRSVEQVRREVKRGNLPAHKVGARWFVLKSDLASYRRTTDTQVGQNEGTLQTARKLRERIRKRAGGDVQVTDLLDEVRGN